VTQGWNGVWQLVIGVLSLVAIHETMLVCSGADQLDVSRESPAWRIILTALAMPVGGRVLLIAVAAPAWGARVALLGLLDWSIIAVGYGITTRSVTWRGKRRQARAPRRAPAGRAESASLAVLLQPARPVPSEPAERPATEPTRPDLAPAPAPDETDTTAPAEPGSGWTAEPDWLSPDWAAPLLPPDAPVSDTPVPDTPWDDAVAEPAEQTDMPGPADLVRERALAAVLRCRDDGLIARWFGGLVRGQLIPLPPALLALTAVVVLARLGLRDLPGVLILAPAIVMLVAAPGSSHPHDGRLDWIVPGVLQGAQYTYIAALGFASGVPALVTFILCAVVALRYADLGSVASPALRTKSGHEPGAWLGWDGRMIVCGLGAAMGIAMVAYLALAAYLAALLCWKVADRLR
jgi:hypothetical protein